MQTILIIDDEPIIRMLVRFTFEPRGYEVLEAEGGTTGLELAQKHQPDLVLLDIALPELSGLEVARRLGERTPVLLLTGLTPDVEPEAPVGSIRGYVEKPFSPAALLARVQEILESEALIASQEAPAA